MKKTWMNSYCTEKSNSRKIQGIKKEANCPSPIVYINARGPAAALTWVTAQSRGMRHR